MREMSIKNDAKIQIGTNIKRKRLAQGMRGVELIAKVNLSDVELNTFSLSKIEANTQHITASQLKAIAKALDCTCDELLQENCKDKK